MTSGRGFWNWRQWLCVSNSIIFTIKSRPIDKSICRNIVYCYQIWNPPPLFYGENLFSENSLWWRQLLTKTQDRSLQPLTILISIADVCMRVFWNTHSEKFGKHAAEFLFWKIAQLSLHPTTRLKTPLQMLLWKWSERKGCSKIYLFLWRYRPAV